MPRPFRVAHGAFGRIALLEIAQPMAPHVHRHCHVLIKAAGSDALCAVGAARLVLDEARFELFRAGRADEDRALLRTLEEANFLRDSYDVPRAALALQRRKPFLGQGPNLHILVVTLRCNESCAYCHASRAPMSATHTDMTLETAERAVDLAMRSTSTAITIEFQGGEPLVAFDVVRHAVEHAIERNRRVQKQLDFTLVSNLSLMDEEKLRWLLDHRVQICTSIDGPAAVHDAQRKLPGGSAHAAAVEWIRRINAAYDQMELDPTLYRVEALLTTTRATIERWREVVDHYVELGCRALFLRPLDPFGFAGRVRDRLGYGPEEFLELYRRTVDYMIALNLDGTEVLERFASIFLTKILTGDDPNYLDIRSPCGAGIGQVAYDWDGAVYTCDEGRMLRADGDESFRIGHVSDSSYRELMGHPTVRATALASNLDAQPECSQCAYQPYCGVCPVYNHKTQGSLFGHMRDNGLCRIHLGIQDYLFGKIAEGDPRVLEVLRKWTTARPRSHFVHAGCT